MRRLFLESGRCDLVLRYNEIVGGEEELDGCHDGI